MGFVVYRAMPVRPSNCRSSMDGIRSPAGATIVVLLTARSFLPFVVGNQLKPHGSRLLELRRISLSWAHLGLSGFMFSCPSSTLHNKFVDLVIVSVWVLSDMYGYKLTFGCCVAEVFGLNSGCGPTAYRYNFAQKPKPPPGLCLFHMKVLCVGENKPWTQRG
jgi:hypothetical protein